MGFSSLHGDLPLTYTFLEDVISEIASVTPGPYISIGGDEADSTSAADYTKIVNHAQQVLDHRGKTLWGWHEAAAADNAQGSVAAYWGTAGSDVDIDLAHLAVTKGQRLVLAPGDRAYLDMKYFSSTPHGQDWAGPHPCPPPTTGTQPPSYWPAARRH